MSTASDKPAAAPVPAQLPEIHSAESQWAIVGRMFKKKHTAVWGLRGAIVLLLLAIYAPVLSSGLPLAWTPPGGETSYPWFSRMFDSNYWTNAVDRFFNLLLVLVTLWGAVALGMRFIKATPEQRQARRTVVRKGFLGVGFVLVLLQAMGVQWLMTSEPYVDYREKAKTYAADHASAKQAGASAEELAKLEHAVTFTLIPYGHREQLPRQEDQYRSVLDFEEGEVHLLGTDKVGRDLFARLLYGTRISLTVGLVAVGIYVTIGTILGAIAGYLGGRADMLIMRLIEIVICIPGLFLILTIVAFFEVRSIFIIMFAIGLVGWTGIARLIRGEFIRERARDYVMAAKSLGIGGPRILFRHILPNAIAPVIVAATFGVAGAIITESTLSFLGLGDVSVPSWGMVLNEGRQDQEWHMILCPGVAIFATVTLLNLVGDGLRDALDPKLRA